MALTVRTDVSVFDLAIITALLVGLILWMLGRLQKGKGLLKAVARVDNTPSSPLQRSSPSTSAVHALQGRRASTMFANAVAKHDATAAKQKALPQQTLLSSSPTQQHSGPRQRPGFKLGNSILNPLPATTMNVPFQKQVPSLSSQGVKRMNSGLAKTFSSQGSFEAGKSRGGSQAQPIILDENIPALASGPSAAYFCEDDFDSDIDLDIEVPVAKAQRTEGGSTASNTFYPTLPRQQALKTHRPETHDDSSYHALGSANFVPPHVPSQSLPWSSSPPQNLQPASRPPRPSAVENGTNVINNQHSSTTISNASDSKRSADVAPKPVKRRTLPWKTQDQEAQARQNGPPPLASAETPKAKSSMWAPTASAVKDQQKAHREANKAKSKFAEAQEKSLEIVRKQQSATSKQLHRVFLSDEQQQILNLVNDKNMSVFFTGSAGTGKSVLLREIISVLRKKHVKEPDRVAVTASTGLAACNIGGVTLHSFAGIGLGKEDVPELVKRIRRNQKAKQRWMRTKILVIDEVSMVDGDLFDKLEGIARTIRNNGRPFGGIQLVITGDFFQLPPVPEGYGRVAKFAFDAASWTTSISHTIGLHQVFRQRDPIFAGMLNEMREGKLTQGSINAFHKLNRPLDPGPLNTMATELFPTRNEVEAANTLRMNQLVGDVKTYEARDGGAVADKANRDRLLANCMAPETIHLKKGAQVMLIKNIDESLVNGSIGTVLGFMNEGTFDRYTDHEEAFLTTQGDRLKDPVDPIEARTKQASNRLLDNMLGSTSQLFPVVRFTLADNTTRDLLCQRETWKIELPNGEVQASRSQIPLILAWALSIHKAQGQTLERVKVDLGKVFENGQAYVALSRATSMAGLQVLRFDAKKVFAHEKVRTFYSNLSRLEGSTGAGADGAGKKKRKTAAPSRDEET